MNVVFKKLSPHQSRAPYQSSVPYIPLALVSTNLLTIFINLSDNRFYVNILNVNNLMYKLITENIVFVTLNNRPLESSKG